MIQIYEDHLITISLSQEPVAIGHLVVKPKEELQTIEVLSDELMQHLFFGASYAATGLFELAHAQGTNIILQEHPIQIDVIARKENDGLDLLWEPIQGDRNQLQDLAKSIQDEIDIQIWNKENPQKTSTSNNKEVIKEDEPQEPQDPSQGKKVNYLLRSLNRVP